MIKKCSLVFTWLVLVVFSAAAQNMDDWSHSAQLEFGGNQKYKALFIPEAVYQEAAAGLSDVRIVDSQGNFVPYYIQSGTSIVRQNQLVYQSEVRQIFKKNFDRYYDFRIHPLKDNADIAGNFLVLNLPAENFLKHIEVYGGFDGESWSYVTTDYVFRAAGREKTELNLGGTKKYTFYRLVMLDNPENIQFNSLQLTNNYTDTQWNNFLKTADADFTMKTEKNYSTVTINNQQKLNVKRILLEVEENFQRSYQLYSNGALWKNGELYNLQLENTKVAGTNIDVGSRPISAAELVLKLDNRDDRPLTIKGIKIEYYIDKLVFPDLGNQPYELYFGSKNAAKPQYELELQKVYIEKEVQDPAQLVQIQGKSLSEAPPSWWNMKYVFNGIIIAVSALLVILILPRLKAKK